MIVLLLLRRMSPRTRHLTGWILLGLGAAVAAAGPVFQVNLYVHAAILATCGIIFLKANPKPRGREQAEAAARQADAEAGADASQEVSRVA